MGENEVEKAVGPLREDAGAVVGGLKDLAVVDEESMKMAIEGGAEVKGFYNRVEKVRKAIVDPLNKHVKFINGEFKKILGPVKEVETVVKDRILAYRRKVKEAAEKEEERLRKLAEKRAEKAKEAGKPAPLPEEIKPKVEAPAKTVSAGEAKATARMVPKFKVFNPEIVPMKYRPIDESLIRKDVKAGVREIIGVRIWEEEELAIR